MLTEAGKAAYNEYHRNYAHDHRDKINEIQRRYRHRHPDKVKENNDRYWNKIGADRDDTDTDDISGQTETVRKGKESDPDTVPDTSGISETDQDAGRQVAGLKRGD